MEVSGQLHAPVALPREKNPLYPLVKRLSELQNRSGYEEKDKKLIHAGNRTTEVQSSARDPKYVLFRCVIRMFGASKLLGIQDKISKAKIRQP
jgi:hypothetical protein